MVSSSWQAALPSWAALSPAFHVGVGNGPSVSTGLGQTVEVNDWVKLDRVGSHPGVAVVEVEERDPGNSRSSAEPDVATCPSHLTTPQRRGVQVATRPFYFEACGFIPTDAGLIDLRSI